MPDDMRLRLDHALADFAPMGYVSAQHPDTWLTADSVMAVYRAARARGRLAARASEDMERGLAGERLFSAASDEEGSEAFRRRLARNGPASTQAPGSTWREIVPVGLAELRARGAAVYGEADQLIRWIPTRFARYLGELLLPEERVLFFAACPPLTLRGWSGRATPLLDHAPEGRRTATWRVSRAVENLRARHLQSGVLIITDRQALLLRDYAAPDATMVQWGYVARSWPLGRLVAAHALSPGIALEAKTLVSWPLSVRDRLVEVASFDEATVPGQYTRLLVALEGAAAIQITGAAFPPEMRPVLERAADLLGQFLPWPGVASAGDRRVRLVPAIEPWRPTEQEAAELMSLGGLVAPVSAEALETATACALQPGEAVLAQARTPRTSEAGPAQAALLTLTPERLLFASYSANQKAADVSLPAVRALTVGSLTTATLHYSLLGCAISVSFPDSSIAGVQRLTVAFPSPVIVPFRALYTRLRLLVGGPIVAPTSTHGE
jgi:hypothetical protein